MKHGCKFNPFGQPAKDDVHSFYCIVLREKSELQTPSHGGCKASHWWPETQKRHPELAKSAKDSRWKLALSPSKSQFSPSVVKAMKEREHYYQMDKWKIFMHYFTIKCDKFLCLFFRFLNFPKFVLKMLQTYPLEIISTLKVFCVWHWKLTLAKVKSRPY